jgi:formylmethanofuran dehydrogenase subunit B
MTAAPSAADLDRARAAITAARRPLVTGLVAADAAVAVAACDLAECSGAAVDPGGPETSRIIGPLVARIGAVTAEPEELRDRADLVVLWFCDPEAAAPGFLARFVAPVVAGTPRRTITVGPHDVSVPGADHRHIAMPPDAAVDLARLVEAAIREVAIDESACASPAIAAARDLAAATVAATTVAIVTDWRADAVGLAAWSTASLVRTLAHRMPAFEIPLGERADPAVAVSTWRYGAAGAIDRADRAGGRFLAAEADAVRLIDRRETDCVVVVGEPTEEVAAALGRAGDGFVVVRLPADAEVLQRLVERVRAEGEPAA